MPEHLKTWALQSIQEIKDSNIQQQVYTQLIEHIPSNRKILEKALATTQKIHDLSTQVQVIADLSPYIQEKQLLLENALSKAQTIKDKQSRMDAFISLIPYLQPEIRLNVLPQALTLAKQLPESDDNWHREHNNNDKVESPKLKALNSLLPYLPDTLFIEVSTIIQGFKEISHQENLLVNLIQYFPENKLEDVLTLVSNINESRLQLKGLIAVAQRLNDQKESIVQRALKLIQNSEDVRDYLCLFPCLSEQERQNWLPQIITQINALIEKSEITGMPFQVRLHEFVNYLPEELIRTALQTTKELNEVIPTQGTWTAPFILRLAELGYSQDAVKEAQEIYDEKICANLWIMMSPHLTDESKKDVLAFIRKRIKYCKEKRYMDYIIGLLRGFAGLWMYLPESLKLDILQEIIETAINSESLCVETFKILMPYLITPTYLESTRLHEIWQTTLHKLSLLHRPDFLQNLRVFLPLALHLSGENGAEKIYRAIERVTRAWP